MEFILFLVIIVLTIQFFDLRSRVRILEQQLPGKEPVQQEPILREEPNEPKKEIVSAVQVKESPVKEIPKPKSPDLEFKWGAKSFTAIGGIALLFGVGFFLRYAFEKNLITPTMRVVIGLAIGLVCIGLGEWLRKKYAAYGQALMGLGLGIFYVTLYAALHLYQLMSSPQAFIAMIAVTVAGLILAVRLDSEPLAAFALLGGLITPMLVSSGDNKPLVLFPYLALLDTAILVFSLIKTWRRINLFGMLGTAAVFLFWYGTFFTTQQWIITEAAVSTFFVIFVIAGLSRYAVHKMNQGSYDLAVTSLNPFLYAVATYAIVPEVYREWVGMYFALLGVLYVGATMLIPKNDERDRRYRNFLAVIGSAFLAAAAPIAYDGNAVTIAWAVLACALTYWSYLMDSKPLRAIGVATGLLASLHVFVTPWDSAGVTPWLNEKFITSIFVIATQAAMVLIHRKKGAKETENVTWADFDTVKTYILTCIVFALEISMFYEHIWIYAALAALALAGGWISLALRSLPLRASVYVSYAFAVLILISEYPSIAASAPLFLNLRVAVTLGLILSLWIFGQIVRRSPAGTVDQSERETIRPVFFIVLHLMALWLLSSEIYTWFNIQMHSAITETAVTIRMARNATLSIVWMIYAIALLVYGFATKFKIARQFAIVLFGIVILKAFLYDTAELSNFYRFISFMTLGVLLLLSGYLYTRFRERKSSGDAH